ncbi:ArsC/Spx/MgsR family protein [Secundilactobacillus oryzae]|uniref:ArsC/Spx/MgsR family protein n=1 Tax=Secundilactobacillus oryzae TaxID=1202668 RepID=UPI0006CF2046|nr:ArsC/Spx/MgsR family protein [Secundilactobacillus oryzae]
MLKFYYNANTPSKRKAIKWLDEQEIEYEVRNINFKPLDEEEITHIMHLSTEGTDQIVSKRSKVMKQLNVALSKLSFNGLVKLIKENQAS